MTWEDEEAEDAADPHYVESGPSAPPGPTPDRSPPSTTPSESSRAGWTPPVQDLTQEEEATQMGFRLGEDEEEPEGPPAVLLAGFGSKSVPVRELLDELGRPRCPRSARPAGESRTAARGRALSSRAGLAQSREDARQVQPGRRVWDAPMRRLQRIGPRRDGDGGVRAEARGLPRLITVVITSENAERTLGEALAEAVKEMRAEKRRVEKVKSMDFVEEMRKLDAAAAKQGATAAELVEREIARQDALAADEAAAFEARDERARIHEARLAKLKEEYETRARARAAAESASGRAPPANARDDATDPSGWPTLENLESMASEYVDEGFEGLDVNLADVNLGDRRASLGADGDALEAMVMDAVKRKTAGASNASDGSNPRPIELNEEAFRASVAFEDSDANANANDDSGVYEVDPTRWSERVDAARARRRRRRRNPTRRRGARSPRRRPSRNRNPRRRTRRPLARTCATPRRGAAAGAREGDGGGAGDDETNASRARHASRGVVHGTPRAGGGERGRTPGRVVRWTRFDPRSLSARLVVHGIIYRVFIQGIIRALLGAALRVAARRKKRKRQ